MYSVNWPKPGYATISNIPYNLIFTAKFNDSSILITIISCDYLNVSLADEHVGDVTIPTQVIEYNKNFLQAEYPIRLKYSNQIKLYIKCIYIYIYILENNIYCIKTFMSNGLSVIMVNVYATQFQISGRVKPTYLFLLPGWFLVHVMGSWFYR